MKSKIYVFCVSGTFGGYSHVYRILVLRNEQDIDTRKVIRKYPGDKAHIEDLTDEFIN